MPVHKRSVSLDPVVWQQLERAAAEEDQPISKMLGDLLSRSLHLRQGERAMDRYEAEFGAFTDQEISEADRALDAADVTAGPRTTVESVDG